MAAKLEKTEYPGVYHAHTTKCVDGRQKCSCPYQAAVWSAREKKRIRKSFDSKKAARIWHADASGAIRAGKMKAPTRTTLQEAADKLVEGMKSGAIYDRKGKPYKPSTIRSYERALRLHVLPVLGHRRLSTLERREVQALVEHMQKHGSAASTVQNTLNPLQVICRRTVRNGEIVVDPTDGLNLPRNKGKRDRIASRQEARQLIDALPESERGFWATAFYGGLRRGELRALRWSDVDLTSQPAVIRVRRTWDDNEGEVDAKTDAGIRDVPLTGRLRALLVEHGLNTRRAGDELVFGRTATLPFIPTTVRARALKAWKAAGLQPLTPHEARHCAASYLIEAGLNDLELSTTIGHSDPRTTKTIYGHLFEDSKATIAAKLDAYLEAEVG